jgi:hypothetical protein
MLDYTFETWALLDKNQDAVCDTCKQPIPPDTYILSNVDTRARVYICYTYSCIANHPRNTGKDVVKITDIRARITITKHKIVRKWGLDYWQRNFRPYIPLGYEDFADSVRVG